MCVDVEIIHQKLLLFNNVYSLCHLLQKELSALRLSLAHEQSEGGDSKGSPDHQVGFVSSEEQFLNSAKEIFGFGS